MCRPKLAAMCADTLAESGAPGSGASHRGYICVNRAGDLSADPSADILIGLIGYALSLRPAKPIEAPFPMGIGRVACSLDFHVVRLLTQQLAGKPGKRRLASDYFSKNRS